ncbi:uncharacterized protein LOC111778914 isoform X1 [Cucurbita pepo subsp. pepo]|uniref:uncharacterized protein LOC111778914 isoform X1 n=1 Tax=Cucurbita pepo subsp. pepo TaxID=3664 RepID=UPI000C9D4659|nr:uncharacterized protein LOC111778914 isoform X1 [Cucurbita pepo subsp. pepo]XP_023514689.1 uncharacterized protein LOC111778914 isoform X1 [Cucurbita pepo subsp. pepo]XP_023514690.1 uncharacterized protein LOC111778914 isoform X1 [Cucurbita pepo subsp. pepo]XP_023514691.1 uncharacterized protein LOC111778914 isoform X1 [Cucurbita pepo subsp. pepo]
MKEVRRRKARNKMEKPFPGCLGRMVNLFDLSAGVSSNKLLTDKPHRDGSVLPRSHSDAAIMSSSSLDSHIEDGLGHSIGKANQTPMKMLIDQEMSKEAESKISPPNVVAKLMGLDTLPEQPGSAAYKTPSRGSPCIVKESRLPLERIEQVDDCLEKGALCEIHQSSVDVYEIWQQSLKTNYDRKKLHYGNFDKNIDEKKIALVRQKFTEAKRMATDEKLRQSKEFQDALEVLSSNKESFVKLLQEPNSLFSQRSFQLCSLPTSPEKTCITILRPSNLVSTEKNFETGKRCENQMRKPTQVCHSTARDKPSNVPTFSNQRVDEYVQPTRIVVLKPNIGKNHGVKPVVTQQASSSPDKTSGNFDEEAEGVEVPELGETATEISEQLSEGQMGHQRDETLISSVFSNGYTGDESSFYKSENEYAGRDLSDLELMSPSSRHSWDYANKFDSPYSISSFSHVSCSPESLVCREAKKHLSERWSTITSIANSHEPRHVRRSSSTLGEMLSLSDPKKSIESIDQITNEEEKRREFASCLSIDFSKEEIENSPRSLQRSKSAPVSPLMSRGRLGFEAPKSATTDVIPEKTCPTKVKSSFKGKISSLFFSRNKKLNKEKQNSLCKFELDTSIVGTLGASPPPDRVGDNASCVNNTQLEECSFSALSGSSETSPDLTNTLGVVSLEAGLPFARNLMPGNAGENLDNPCPCSVFEPLFDEDDFEMCSSSGHMKPDIRGIQVPTKSNLIDKSPPIESIFRTSTWENKYSENTDPYLVKPSLACEDTENEEQKWLGLVKTLLSANGLDDSVQCNSFFSRWHSLDYPLDPSLRDRFANLSAKEPEQEAKQRESSSNWKLIFDSVNAILVDIAGFRSDRSTMAMSYNWVNADAPSQALVDSVWDRLKDWLSCETQCVGFVIGDISSLVVERVVRKEVVGKSWIQQLQEEMDDLGKEIEGKLLEELVEEALLNLTEENEEERKYCCYIETSHLYHVQQRTN